MEMVLCRDHQGSCGQQVSLWMVQCIPDRDSHCDGCGQGNWGRRCVCPWTAGAVLILQQNLSWAIRGGARGETFPCLSFQDLWLRLSLAGGQGLKLSPKQTPAHEEGAAPSCGFALESSSVTPTLIYTMARTANKHFGNIASAWTHWVGWEMPAQVSQMQCLSWSCCPGSICPWRSRTVQDKPSPAQHRAWAGSPCSLCLSAENNGNPFRSTLGVSQLVDESSPQFFLSSFSAHCCPLSQALMPAVLCVCSLLLVTNSLVKPGVGALSQHIQYPLALKWLTHGF